MSYELFFYFLQKFVSFIGSNFKFLCTTSMSLNNHQAPCHENRHQNYESIYLIFNTNRFKIGLMNLGVLAAACKYNHFMKAAFTSSNRAPLTAEEMEALFEVPEEAWAPEGSNKRRAENKTLTHWRNFLMELEGEKQLQPQ